MTGLVSHFLVLAILLPGLILAYLPVKDCLKLPTRKLAAFGIPAVLLLCGTAGFCSLYFAVDVRWLFPPLAAIAGIFYTRTLALPCWKSIRIYLAVYAAFSCLSNTAAAIDNLINKGTISSDFTMFGSICYFLLCCAFLLLSWYPATHGVKTLMEDEAFDHPWYVFWLLPLLFIGVNISLHPNIPGILTHGKLNFVYLAVSLFLLLLLCLFYALFYLMASSLNQNVLLRTENQFLSMQQARYDSLKTTIEETRQFRHDLRHHFDILSGFASQNEWEKLTAYLTDARGNIPDADLSLCENTAADSVAGHYGALYRKADIPVSFILDLPAVLPVSEMDFCIVLSNLLENALEASLKIPVQKRKVKVQAHLHTQHMLLLSVENTFEGKIIEKDGTFQSSKRKGMGVGIQSVRHIAEKNGGYSRFFYEGGSFHANVMLRGKAAED